MLSAYRRSTVGVVLAVNGLLKPRLFTTITTLRSKQADSEDAAVNVVVGRRVFDTVRIDGTSTAEVNLSPEVPLRKVFPELHSKSDALKRYAVASGPGKPNGTYIETVAHSTRIQRQQELKHRARDGLITGEEPSPLTTIRELNDGDIIKQPKLTTAEKLNQKFIHKYKKALSPSFPNTDKQPNKDKALQPSRYAPGRLHKGMSEDVIVSGFLGAQRKVGKLLFAPLTRKGKTVQLVCSQQDSPEAFEALLAKSITPNSAIEVLGHVRERPIKPPKVNEVTKALSPLEEVELVVEDVKYLAEFPGDIVVGEVAKYGPEQRHLQLRFEEDLADRIRFRSRMTKKVHELLSEFTEVDTPILFKSTPEGAREFLVPTRNLGMAYALPQSPQQYKQILMASGVDRYYQMAHCFRDEDLRADRQPEFMQLDLEMAFCRGEDVMIRVEKLVKELWKYACEDVYGERAKILPLPDHRRFPAMTYHTAMSRHGVDKPDLRIKDEISKVAIPESLEKMMTSIENPIIETFKFNLSVTPDEVRAFVAEIMSSPDFRPFHANAAGPPGVFVYDPSKPLSGLHAFGHEGLENIENHFRRTESRRSIRRAQSSRSKLELQQREHQAEGLQGIIETSKSETPDRCMEMLERAPVEAKKDPNSLKARSFIEPDTTAAEEETPDAFAPGDLIIMQARPNARFNGGSTAIGRLRTLIHRAAVEKGYMTMPPGFEPLWVVDFPLFTPNNDVDPGQGGTHGFSATHHPFTSPKTPADVDMCVRNPLKAIADHYDLVINGVELGGGSGRIHNAEMQEYVLKEVIGMKQERVEDFRHLLEALRAGCPPHAGLALGWDRLIALMCGKESIRDVLAFPKDGKGRDALVGSPSEMTMTQLGTYHLKVNKNEKE